VAVSYEKSPAKRQGFAIRQAKKKTLGAPQRFGSVVNAAVNPNNENEVFGLGATGGGRPSRTARPAWHQNRASWRRMICYHFPVVAARPTRLGEQFQSSCRRCHVGRFDPRSKGIAADKRPPAPWHPRLDVEDRFNNVLAPDLQTTNAAIREFTDSFSCGHAPTFPVGLFIRRIRSSPSLPLRGSLLCRFCANTLPASSAPPRRPLNNRPKIHHLPGLQPPITSTFHLQSPNWQALREALLSK